MIDGRCGSCRFWETDPKWDPGTDDHPGECVRMRHDGTSPVDRRTWANAFSTVEEDATVFTQRRFGCVMHESRPQIVYCAGCGKEFTSTGKVRLQAGRIVYCSDECRRAAVLATKRESARRQYAARKAQGT